MKENVTMATQMIIRLESNLKNKVSQLAKAEGKNLSELVRELLEKHTKERDASACIDNLWEKIGQNLAQNNISESDIEKTIEHVRSKNV
jgi:predicted DNA-binding protein